LKCFFTSDLHGQTLRYALLFDAVSLEAPDAVFLGGDLFDVIHHFPPAASDLTPFFEQSLADKIRKLRHDDGLDTRFFVIMGNDDPRCYEPILINADHEGLISYVHARTLPFKDLYVTGYSYVPPTPFRLKDWERYDVSGYVDPGTLPPDEGLRTVRTGAEEASYATIAEDLDKIVKAAPVERTIFLFHAPPYGGKLDVAYRGTHIGSIAIQRFITRHQPLLTLHGHIHESPDMTGSWQEKIGRTYAFSGVNDAPGLTLIRFDTNRLETATRQNIPPTGERTNAEAAD